MSVETVQMYRVVCDGGCGAKCPHPDGEISAWSDVDTPKDEAIDNGWLFTDDGRHFCDRCKVYDEERDEYTAPRRRATEEDAGT